MKLTKSVEAIVVTYNKPELLKTCLSAIVNQTYSPTRVLVIDNGALATTRAVIKTIYENTNVPVIHHVMSENVGGAGGFSKGIEIAAQKNSQFLWIMDDDTLPHDDTLQKLMEADEYCDERGISAGFFASNVRWIDDFPAVMNLPSLISVWNDFTDANLLEIRSCSFVSVLIRTSEIRKAGLPIQEFFIWRDDVEFTRRISQHARAFFVEDSRVTHQMAENKGVNILQETDSSRVKRYYYDVRNGMYFERHYNGVKGVLKFTMKEIALIPRALRTQAGWAKAGILMKGLFAGWNFHPKVRPVPTKKGSN